MKVVEEFRQVALPTEYEEGVPCSKTARDLDTVLWTCTRHPGHDGPHTATYDAELDEGLVTMIGLAWVD